MPEINLPTKAQQDLIKIDTTSIKNGITTISNGVTTLLNSDLTEYLQTTPKYHALAATTVFTINGSGRLTGFDLRYNGSGVIVIMIDGLNYFTGTTDTNTGVSQEMNGEVMFLKLNIPFENSLQILGTSAATLPQYITYALE